MVEVDAEKGTVRILNKKRPLSLFGYRDFTMAVQEVVLVKPGATVIDVGVNRITDPSAKDGTRLVGDVAFAEVQPIAGRITPNPGGVGPMTIALLMQNTVRAAELATA